jgi:hypothetical protein
MTGRSGLNRESGNQKVKFAVWSAIVINIF